MVGYSALQTSIFRSGGEKFADFVFTRRTSHIPHVVIWFSLMFDSKLKGRIWLIHLQRTTGGKFFEEFYRATLVASCLHSRMESTNAVWLVLALTCFGPSLISPHKNLIQSPFLGLSLKWRLPNLIGGFRHHKVHNVRCKAVEFEVPNSPHSKSLSSSALVSSQAACGLFPLP